MNSGVPQMVYVLECFSPYYLIQWHMYRESKSWCSAQIIFTAIRSKLFQHQSASSFLHSTSFQRFLALFVAYISEMCQKLMRGSSDNDCLSDVHWSHDTSFLVTSHRPYLGSRIGILWLHLIFGGTGENRYRRRQLQLTAMAKFGDTFSLLNGTSPNIYNRLRRASTFSLKVSIK